MRPGIGMDRSMSRRSSTVLRTIVTILLLTLAVACTEEKSEAELASEALVAGLAAHAEGNLAEAAASYREVLVHEPNNKYAYYNLGLIDQTNDALASAESNYRLALGIDPQMEEALFNLAIVEHDLENLTESINLYQQTIEVAPDNAEAHLNLGFALIENNRRQDGKEELAIADQTRSRSGGPGRLRRVVAEPGARRR